MAALALSCGAAKSADAPTPAWTTYGGSATRLSDADTETGALGRQFVLPLGGSVTGQVLAANGLFYAATNAGQIVGFDANGYVRWRDDLGQLSAGCPQLSGYGLAGTGVIDPTAGILYVADAFGWLHALALSTGAEEPGWPVRMFTDDTRELDWGALALADGGVYVPTASYCDTANTRGGVLRVDTTTRAVTRWLSVPLAQGGGGGPWGWGGVVYDGARNALFVGTSGAFSGGTNTGTAYTETVGYGDRMVELNPSLNVEASSHPADIPDRQDLDLVGSPVVVDSSACGSLVVQADKDDTVYAWNPDDVDSGPVWEVPLEAYDIHDPFLTNLAWSGSQSAFFAVSGTQVVRISLGDDCQPSIGWAVPLGTATENGSPTVAGDTLWFALNGKNELVGYDVTNGQEVYEAPLGGTTVEAPTIVDGRLMIGTLTGLVEGFSFGAEPLGITDAPAPKAVAAETSWANTSDGLQSRANGVYSTTNAGKTWQLVYPKPALAVLRVSKATGVISVGYDPGDCMCATQQLWTTNGGKTWHATPTLSGSFTAANKQIYFWENGTLRLLGPLSTLKRITSKVLASGSGDIIGAVSSSAGLVAVVSSRVAGVGWDTTPRVIVANGPSSQAIALPTVTGHPLVTGISGSGENITVTAEDFTVTPVSTITWTSADGGLTWSQGAA